APLSGVLWLLHQQKRRLKKNSTAFKYQNVKLDPFLTPFPFIKGPHAILGQQQYMVFAVVIYRSLCS
ncbi:MAG: hypothetical protein KAR13_17080, partial [Desulfobulbaceae bacterium]|nr:hypothetical protein [Desulfobulbaceae bacterium]